MKKRRFIITDSCWWNKRKNNRPRSPHYIEVVDATTGQIRYLKSGTLINIVRERK